MSQTTARFVLDQMNGRPTLIEARYAKPDAVPGLEVTSSGFMGDLRQLALAAPQVEEERANQHRREIAAAYGLSYDPKGVNSKPFLFVNGYAIIPIHGMLINRFSYSWGYVTGYNFIRAQVLAALADDDVVGIIYDINTRGGMVAGCAETSAIMRSASQKGGGKPSLAVVDHNCYSAGYMLGCAADKLAVTPTGGAGSIGVLLMHMDLSAMLAEAGVKISFIFAGDHKVDGNAYEPLSDEVRADLQAEINSLYDDFVKLVASNRPMTEQQVRDTQARCYLPKDALSIGLIDSIATPDQALERFFSDSEDDEEDDPTANLDENVDSGNNEPVSQESNMTEEEIKAAQDKAVADALAADRKRQADIKALPEAKGRGKLAEHLAMGGYTVEQATGILANARSKADDEAEATSKGKEVTATGGKETEANHFKNAMDQGKQPNVGGNDAATGGDGEQAMTPSQRILAAQQKATGRGKVVEKK